MNRFVVPAILALAIPAFGAETASGQLDASPTLFTVMAAIHAAGFDADMASPNSHPLRQQVVSAILARNPASLPAIKAVYEKRRNSANAAAELSQYISFALSVKGAPDFTFAARDVEVPPDAAALRELAPLLTEFYAEADIPNLWKRSQAAIEQYIALYHGPVSRAVLGVNAYLRQQTSGFQGRTFQIYLELLAPPNQVQTRSYGDHFTVVVTPSPEPRIFDIRHGYLHYLLDPLATRYHEILERKKAVGDHAQRAPALDAAFKEDFLQLATESLIKAVESRLDRKPAAVEQALRQGHVLTPYFAEKLALFEKQEQSMPLYYPEMIKAIDLMTEEKRLLDVEFDREAVQGAVVRPAAPAPLTGAARTLEGAERLYAARNQDKANLDSAKKLFLQVLDQTDNQQVRASAYYGLARIATLQNDPASAEQLFQKTLELQPEPQAKAWTLVYLGRLSQAAQEPEQAAKYFQEVLKVDGAPEGARKAAADGLQNTSKQQTVKEQ